MEVVFMNVKHKYSLLGLKLFTGFLLLITQQAVFAQSDQDMAKEVANPLTSLTYLPLQLNYDSNIGPVDDGDRVSFNIQPLTSFSLNDDWSVISRTIFPIIKQNDIYPSAGSQSGLGDIVQSFFFSPVQATESGWIWGAGPAILLPTATDDLLGADKWGIGPTVVGAKVTGPWTFGVLANHIVSFSGRSSDKQDVNATFVQPFLDYTTESAVTYEITTESTYNHESDEWSVPVVLTANILTQIGDQLIMYGGGVRYWAKSAESDPEDWSFNLVLYFLYP